MPSTGIEAQSVRCRIQGGHGQGRCPAGRQNRPYGIEVKNVVVCLRNVIRAADYSTEPVEDDAGWDAQSQDVAGGSQTTCLCQAGTKADRGPFAGALPDPRYSHGCGQGNGEGRCTHKGENGPLNMQRLKCDRSGGNEEDGEGG